MIGKVTKGSDFAGLVSYLLGDRDRVGTVSFFNLAANNCEGATALMEVQASLSKRTQKPVFHLSVSYDVGDVVSAQEMTIDAARLLKDIGALDRQAIFVIHSDKDHSHFHLCINRVSATGIAWHDRHSYAKIETSLRKIEAEKGLRAVPGRHSENSIGPRYLGPSQPVRFRNLPDAVVDAMTRSQSWTELHTRLKAEGWVLLEPRSKRGRRSNGLILSGPNGEFVKASAAGRDCSSAALHRRFEVSPTGVEPPITQFRRYAFPSLTARLVSGRKAVPIGLPRILRTSVMPVPKTLRRIFNPLPKL